MSVTATEARDGLLDLVGHVDVMARAGDSVDSPDDELRELAQSAPRSSSLTPLDLAPFTHLLSVELPAIGLLVYAVKLA